MKLLVRHAGGELTVGSQKEFLLLWQRGVIAADDMVRREGQERWTAAGELPWIRRLGPMGSPPVSKSFGTAAHRSPIDHTVKSTLKAEGISLAFSGLQVLKAIDLAFEPGEALGLIGPNGAGKTTLVNVLSGFQEPNSGTVTLDGVDVTGRSPTRLAHDGLGRTFQAALPFPHLSALESVAVGAMGMGVGRRRAVAVAADVLDRLNLLERAALPAGSLPPGGRRLLGVARALAIEPRYLLLDEPAAGLNDAECEELVEILRNVLLDFGCGILLVEHDMSIVMELCPRVQVLDDGMTLRVGTPEEVQADPAVVESYLGSSFLATVDA